MRSPGATYRDPSSPTAADEGNPSVTGLSGGATYSQPGFKAASRDLIRPVEVPTNITPSERTAPSPSKPSWGTAEPTTDPVAAPLRSIAKLASVTFRLVTFSRFFALFTRESGSEILYCTDRSYGPLPVATDVGAVTVTSTGRVSSAVPPSVARSASSSFDDLGVPLTVPAWSPSTPPQVKLVDAADATAPPGAQANSPAVMATAARRMETSSGSRHPVNGLGMDAQCWCRLRLSFTTEPQRSRPEPRSR